MLHLLLLRLLLCIGGVAVRYQCDFLIQGDDGEVIVGRARAFDARNLPQAIKWVDEKVQSAPEIFHKAYAVRLRHDDKVVWLKALGALHARRT
jgi:hypothetical protein